LKIKIDKYFFYSLLPFILLGGSIRALKDYSIIYNGPLFCTPLIYFVVFFITLGSLLFSIALQRTLKTKYYKIFGTIGTILLIFNLAFVRINNLFGFGMILIIAAVWMYVFFSINRFKPKILSFENAGILSAHLFDASATFVALTFFNYAFIEEHVLPRYIISFSPWFMFLLKIVVVYPVLLAIDKYSENELWRRWLKIIALILGLALGTRDLLTVSMYAA